jgi:hypothetical protein
MQATRQTISWQDFASPQGGFDRSNEALSKSLLFSPPVQEQIQHWPEEREEMQKKLKKAYKEAIPFTWDTTPAVVNARGAFVEEMFLDIWVELLYGGGWTDTEELTFREANWVLVSSESAFNFLAAQLNRHSGRRWNTSYKALRRRSQNQKAVESFFSKRLFHPPTKTSLLIPSRKKQADCFHAPRPPRTPQPKRRRQFGPHAMKQSLTPFFVDIPLRNR